ncbi:MAG: hypothetical protein ABEJ04_00400 [Halobacteriaceae archaeon]
MPRTPALLAALLLLSAGCIGGPATGGETTTAPTTTTTTTASGAGTSTVAPDALPPGVTGDGLNESALLAAHAETLARRGATVRSNYTVEGAGVDRYDDLRVTERATVGPNATRLSVRGEIVMDGNRTASAKFANRSLVLMRNARGDEARYYGRELPAGERDPTRGLAASAVQRRRLADLLRGGNFSVTAAEGDRVTLVATTFADGEETRYADRRVRLVVDGDGVVRSLVANGTLADGGAFRYEYRVDALGATTVATPAWVASAPEIVHPRLDVGFENCTSPYLRVANRGGDVLPAGTTLTLTTGGETYRIAFESALAPDETRYVYRADGQVRVASEAPDPATVDGFGHEAEVNVATAEGFHVLSGGFAFQCATASEDGDGGSSGGGESASAGG